jgi:exodeoxyribonuclease-5
MVDLAFEECINNLLPFTPTREQQVLINKLVQFSSKNSETEIFTLIGYAGTGKTSILGALAKTFDNFRRKYVLLAPTGRAAKVLQGKTNKFTSTIHKHIYQPRVNSSGVTSFLKKKNKATRTIYIVDESSMIHHQRSMGEGFENSSVLDDLIDFIFSSPHNQLLLVGDTAQLPPVGLEYSMALNSEELRHSFWRNTQTFTLRDVQRQQENSAILRSATTVRQYVDGEFFGIPQLAQGKNDAIWHQDRYDLEYAIEKSYQNNGEEDTIILCRSNKRANQFNQRIRYHFFGRESEIEKDDLLMVAKNNYFWLEEDSPAGFIANGEMGKVTQLKKIIELYGFRFAIIDLQLVDYPQIEPFETYVMLDTLTLESPNLSFAEQSKLYHAVLEDFQHLTTKKKRFEAVKKSPYFNALQIKFAYALTCHKSQGGQWKEVFIEQPFWDIDLLEEGDLKWLYTAITRASDKVHYIGFNKKFFE